MPNQPKTEARTVRISDDLWAAVRTRASKHGESVSDVVRRKLTEYVTAPEEG